MSKIILSSVFKKYDNSDFFTINDFDIEIDDKEFIVFVGPSGCGKSTILRMIAGLEDFTDGQFIIDGKVMNDVAAKDREIAMVFQNYALYPHMSVYENMAFSLHMRKHKKEEIRQRVNEVAEILMLTGLLHRKPGELSGGQRQRVAMGRAMVRDAKIFLMDEPLSNLDAKLRVSMRAEIAKLHRNIEATTIYVTHDQTEAMTLADRIVILNKGVIQQIGAPQQVYHQPANLFVAGFIGSPAMNFIDVRVTKDLLINKDGLTFSIPPQHLKYFSDGQYEGRDLTLGIRPEDISSDILSAEHSYCSMVSFSEMLGAETIVYSTIGDLKITSKMSADHSIKMGESAYLMFNMNKASYFDKNSGLNIMQPLALEV